MSRPIRIEYPGAIYHIMSHASGRQWIYKSPKDLDLFIRCLRDVKIKFGIKIHAAVLMRNHYHLLVETPEANLSKVMLRFNSGYSRLINLNLKRRGPVFQKRYKAILVEKSEYFMGLVRYIAQNPVRVKIVERCKEYEGGFIEWLGHPERNDVIHWEEIKEELGGGPRWKGKILNAVNSNMEPAIEKAIENSMILGTKEWVERVIKREGKLSAEENSGKKEYHRISFSDKRLDIALRKFPASNRKNIEAYLRFELSELSIADIARSMGVQTYHSMAQRIYRIRKRIASDPMFKRKIELAKSSVKC